ncbi:HAMP domain-containing histidine kinase [bacterium SCSIO 12643]|nr:HAMP domain-containing histidine kinase [bacterium SCSIO 12643]
MKLSNRTIIGLLSVTILITISIQAYWNVVHYNANKIELLDQVHNRLDKAIESYYAQQVNPRNFDFDITDTSFHSGRTQIRQIVEASELDTVTSRILSEELQLMNHDTMYKKEVLILKSDSFQERHIRQLASKIMISIQEDSIDLGVLHKLIHEDFTAQNWDFPFGIVLKSTVPSNSRVLSTYGLDQMSADYLSVKASSPLLPNDEEIEIRFTNSSKILLQKSGLGILLSLFLSIAIIGSLFILLRIISQQKHLAEIKNDLISNITHEFKTPITTISTALQGMESFNETNDPVKNKRYIEISKLQLSKLYTMVEKLLETATLDTDQLTIKIEKIVLKDLLEPLVSKHQFTTSEKSITFHIKDTKNEVRVDPFHFENVMNNLIDNAIKYGGDRIAIEVNCENEKVIIQVKDNGSGISPEDQKLVFDKFYRVQKGNIHDVKGFGIGLYYCKKIIEKHLGELQLNSSSEQTIFTIILP